MPLVDDDATVELGRITIVIDMGVGNTGPRYSVDGVDHAAAMGYVLAVLDSMRADQRLQWDRVPGPEGVALNNLEVIVEKIAEVEGDEDDPHEW